MADFPKNEIEALAMLYVQNQDLSGLSPEQFLDKYQEAYDKMKVHSNKTNSERNHLGWSVK